MVGFEVRGGLTERNLHVRNGNDRGELLVIIRTSSILITVQGRPSYPALGTGLVRIKRGLFLLFRSEGLNSPSRDCTVRFIVQYSCPRL